MKKTITFCIAAIFFMLSATSCNKICECTQTHENPDVPTKIYDMDMAAVGVKKCSELNHITEDASGRSVIECVKKTN